MHFILVYEDYANISSPRQILKNECHALSSLDFWIDPMSAATCLDLLAVAIESSIDAKVSSQIFCNFNGNRTVEDKERLISLSGMQASAIIDVGHDILALLTMHRWTIFEMMQAETTPDDPHLSPESQELFHDHLFMASGAILASAFILDLKCVTVAVVLQQLTQIKARNIKRLARMIVTKLHGMN